MEVRPERGIYVFWHVVLDEMLPQHRLGIRVRGVRPSVEDGGAYLRAVMEDFSRRVPDVGELGHHNLSLVGPGESLVVTYDDFGHIQALATENPDRWRSYLQSRAFSNDEIRGRRARNHPAVYSFVVGADGVVWEPETVEDPSEENEEPLTCSEEPPCRETPTWLVTHRGLQWVVNDCYGSWANRRAPHYRLTFAEQVRFEGARTAVLSFPRPHIGWSFSVSIPPNGHARKVEWESPADKMGCGGLFLVQVQTVGKTVEIFFEFVTAGTEPCIAGLFLGQDDLRPACVGIGARIHGSCVSYTQFTPGDDIQLVAAVGI